MEDDQRAMNKKICNLKKKIVLLSKSEAYYWRNRYINSFVDMRSDIYKKYIVETQTFSDGECYVGYLWDTLKSYKKIKNEEINRNLPSGNQKVLVFWDIHSRERILKEDYWIFEKDDVIELEINLLLGFLDYLPEDIYVFDRTLKWSVIFTHETEGEGDWPDCRIIIKVP